MAATSTDRRPVWAGRLVRWISLAGLGVLTALTGPFLHAQQTTQSPDQLRWRSPSQSSERVTAQHSLTLAQPIAWRETGRGTTDQSPGTVLRWRTSGVVQARVSSDGPDRPAEIVTVSTVTSPPDRMPPAPAAASAIPYRVPDAAKEPWEADEPPRTPPRELTFTERDQPLALAVLLQEPEPEKPRAGQPSLAPAPARPRDGMSPSEAEDDPVPRPQVQLLPEPAGASGKQPCDRVYNERDCCKDEQKCDEARHQWQHNAISKISLDITPGLIVDEGDPLGARSERNLDLAQVPVRTYRDRQGREMATGRLTGMQYRRLLVLDQDNRVVKVPWDDLSDDDLCFVASWWRIPTECTLGDEMYAGRDWLPSTLTWKATGVCHKPLYFEEPQLERYGHTTGHFAQPVLSGAHFFLNLAALPYQAGINPPWECQYPLGYYRPGSCAPWLVPPVPLSVRGALWEAGAWVGGIALIP